MSDSGSFVPLRPLRFTPVLKSYTWGGRKLATVLGRDLPPGRTAESWEISAHPNGPTPVARGPLAGITLDDLHRRLGVELVGRRNLAAVERDRFPLLVKVLDAAEWLSVQVHPDDRQAERLGEAGKTEMWVVLAADAGAELILGFERETDRRSFAAAAADGATEGLLHRAPVRTGDVFFVAPGTIHALGPGILLAEIQQSSDLTYRVFDWNRDEPDRPLHLERALEVLDFDAVRPGPVVPESLAGEGWSGEILASCGHFETHRLRLPAGGVYEGTCDGASFEVWGVIKGETRVVAGGAEETLRAVEWALLPASLGAFTIHSPSGATLLRVFTP